jgi:hypothetical protein
VGLIGRFMWAYLTDPGPTGRVQSLVIGAALLIAALLFVLLGVLGDLLRANRILTEQTLRRVRRIELSVGVPPDDLLERGLDTTSASDPWLQDPSSRSQTLPGDPRAEHRRP